MPQTVVPVRTKQPDEIAYLTFDFGTKLVSGDAITGAPIITFDTGISILSSQVSGNLVTLRIGGGADQKLYKINVRMNTNLNASPELDVYIRIRDGHN